MSTARMALTPLQDSLLAVLAGMEPPWTLTGGAALAGFHTGHRGTRDLDLFWHGEARLEDQPAQVEARLRAAGLELARLQTTPSFVRLSARSQGGGGEVVIVDLVADPVPVVEGPTELLPGVWVDTPHEILVNKLTALLSRSEVRDLEDVRVLLERGGELERALRDAPCKDGGFSALTLGWLLSELSLEPAAELGFDRERLERFRADLVHRITVVDEAGSG